MCRSIRRLRLPDGVATEDEVEAAALQFVRKVSGVRSPSPANREAFDRAVEEIAASSLRLLEALPRLRTPAPAAARPEPRPEPRRSTRPARG